MTFRTTLAALGIAGLMMAAAPAQAAKDQLTIGVAQFPSTLHPNIDAEVIKSYTLGFVIRNITAFDKDWKNTCLSCTELPSVKNGTAKIIDLPNGGKGMEVTIKLKPDLKWADGKPVTTKDLEFTWRLGRDPKTGFSNSQPWTRAVKIDIIDATTAVLTLDKVLASYNEWDQILPEHIEGPVYEKAKEAGDYIKQTTYARNPTTPGLYNGPYMVTGYTSGSQVVLEPNPYWAGTKPGFKRIVLKLIENTAALQANLLSGDVDMIGGEGVGLSIDQVLELRKQHPDRFEYLFKPSLNYELRAYRPAERQPAAEGSAGPAGPDLRGRPQDADRPSVPGVAAGGRYLGQSAQRQLHQGHAALPLRSAQGEGASSRGRLEARPRRHLPRRRGHAPVAGVRHHGGQSLARIAAGCAAEQLEGRLHRGAH